jgi:hypothetical protein
LSVAPAVFAAVVPVAPAEPVGFAVEMPAEVDPLALVSKAYSTAPPLALVGAFCT